MPWIRRKKPPTRLNLLDSKGSIAVFVLPFILQILSMLILFFRGKDFSKLRKEAA
jgi:hypothetical protein